MGSDSLTTEQYWIHFLQSRHAGQGPHPCLEVFWAAHRWERALHAHALPAHCARLYRPRVLRLGEYRAYVRAPPRWNSTGTECSQSLLGGGSCSFSSLSNQVFVWFEPKCIHSPFRWQTLGTICTTALPYTAQSAAKRCKCAQQALSNIGSWGHMPAQSPAQP